MTFPSRSAISKSISLAFFWVEPSISITISKSISLSGPGRPPGIRPKKDDALRIKSGNDAAFHPFENVLDFAMHSGGNSISISAVIDQACIY